MNLRPLVRQLSIVTKDIQVVRFEPNWAQNEYLDEVQRQMERYNRVRIITLKARQLGISTVTTACAFSMAFAYEYYKGMIVAHENDASEHLLGMVNTYWEQYPFRRLYTPKHLTVKNMKWKETGSELKIATAKNATTGRSKTIHFLHASEVAFWEKPGTTMLGLRQTIPDAAGTFVVLESTANGQGNYFHSMWNLAVDGEVEYVPLFFPWWRHPEYLASYVGLPYHNIGQLDDEERALRSMGLSDDRLAWRRWAIKNKTENDIEKFHQEYPSTPEEAFVASGRNVFPIHHLRRCYEPMAGIDGHLLREGNRVRFVPDPRGPLRIFRTPAADRDWGRYFIGADPTQTTRGDFGCAQVINRRTLEQVAVWRGRIDPGTFAEELAKLGIYYNTAGIAPEKEGPGSLTIGKLLGMEYPFVWQHAKIDKTPGKVTGDTYGWSTTAQTKHAAIGWLLKVLVDGDITIHDRRTYHEMRDYVTTEDGGYGPAAEDGFDDTVMGMAIAIICHMLEGPVPAYGLASAEAEDEDDGTRELVGVSASSMLPWESWGEDDET